MLQFDTSLMPNWQADSLPHLWMPYAQMQTTPQPLAVVGAEGCTLHLEDGRELIDGISSWWSVCHGYQHPRLIKAIQEQAEQLAHVMFAGVNHQSAAELMTRLAKISPEGLQRVFFSDSGSTAVEVSLKMAAQYWRNQGNTRKSKFISFHNGYHGDTMGAMSLCDPNRGMHSVFNGYMPRQFCLPIPQDELAFKEFEDTLDGINSQVAGLIIEPLLQGAGGMKFHSADVLAEIYRITKQYDIFFIADECATGFGRTGYLFACEEAGISPDMMTVSKALTGGMMTLAATLTSEAIFEGFLDDDLYKAFMHGPTFMANPIACAAANASLQLFDDEPRLQQVADIEAFMQDALSPCRYLPGVVDVRVKGAVGVVQFDPAVHDIWQMRQGALELGVWLRPFGDALYLMPPFVITTDELGQLCRAVHALLQR